MMVRHFSLPASKSDEQFSFIYIGWDKKLCYYWLKRFSENYLIKSKNRIIASRSILKYLDRNKDNIDLSIIESTNKVISDKYPFNFMLPRWMEMELNIESSLKTTAIKKIIRIIKRYSLEYEIRNGIEALDFFYHRMYKSEILKRHGESAFVADYNYFHNKFTSQECKLFFLIWENEPVAGIFIEKTGGSYRLTASGIRDGNSKIFKIGALRALQYYIMLDFYEKGISTLLLGSSMPIVFDGVTESKLHIGARPYLKDLEGRDKFYLIPLNAKAATARTLKSNPIFYLSGHNLNIALFLSAEDYKSREEFFTFLNRIKPENAETTRIFCFDSFEKIAKWIKEEGITNIELIKYDGKVDHPA
jgi:hypothetical protein